MDDTLLATKLHTPQPDQTLVLRPRLMVVLSKVLASRLTLVCAPAGYGKTTLVNSWLHETDVPSAWLSLDEGDNDPIRFSQYFITALQKIVPAIQMDLLNVLQGMQSAPYEALVNIIINEVARYASPLVLVLDDFHTIHAHPVLELVAYLVEHIPPNMHLALLSRTDPPLPLSRLRARYQLVEIRAEQLRFTPEEVAIFLNNVMGLRASQDDIAAMAARTEGWIAGLQLAALSMQGREDIHGFVSAFTGSHYYIMDYLTEEVLKLQTDRVRSFLLRTSILSRMCGPLCEAMVNAEGGEPVNGQDVLEALAQMNLFVVPMDDQRLWYRYHHLFSDVLNRRLEQQSPDQLASLHRRASLWFEQSGLIYDAIHHATQAGDLARAARLVDQHGCILLMRGEVVNLLSWIEAVEPYSQTVPWIAIQKVWALCLTGQLDRVDGPLQVADRLIASLEPGDDVGTMSGAIAAARAFRANMRGEARLAADFARQALSCLPVSNDFSCSLRGAATSILGDASWLAGDLIEARRAYTDAVQISQAAGNIHMSIIASSNLAGVRLEQGYLHQSAWIFSETLRMAALPDGQFSPLSERVYVGLSRIAYEWNHLEDAREHIHQSIQFSQRWGSVEYLATGYAMLARLENAWGNPEKAQEAMRMVEQLLSQYTFTRRQSIWLKSALARLWIAQGNLARTYDLLQESGITLDGFPLVNEIAYLQEPAYLILLRIHLTRSNYDTALALSEQLLQTRTAADRLALTVELLVLQALAWQGKKDMQQSMAVLERALLLAQPEGYARVFLDEGEPMARLLFQAKTHRIGQINASQLLSAFEGTPRVEYPPTQLLIEPLTPREIEVLKLIEAGNSNQVIADRLVISMPTVKRHISNIYAKLGVESRTQAVSLGRELRLFE